MSNHIVGRPESQISEIAEHVCCQSKRCKLGSVAMGVLALGIATLLLFSQFNLIAYVTFGLGGALIATSAVLTMIDLIRTPKETEIKEQ